MGLYKTEKFYNQSKETSHTLGEKICKLYTQEGTDI